MIGTILLLLAAVSMPFLAILLLHIYAKFKIVKLDLNTEKTKREAIEQKLLQIESDYSKLRSELQEAKKVTVPKWTIDPRKMTYEQLERCTNYFIENYNQVKN